MCINIQLLSLPERSREAGEPRQVCVHHAFEPQYRLLFAKEVYNVYFFHIENLNT